MNDYNISNYEKYLIKNKKEKHANSKEFKEKLECDIEGIYIETDRCSVNEEELDFS